MRSRIAFVLASACCLAIQQAYAISCFSDLGTVRDVDPDHLAAQARRVVDRLAQLGSAVDSWHLESLETAFRSPQAEWAIVDIQRVLDAHVLVSVSVSAEAEIKATAGPAKPYLPAGGWGAFLVKVHNLAGLTSQLSFESENEFSSEAQTAADRWMQFQLWPADTALSGERVDYFVLTVRGDVIGKREGLFVISSGSRPSEPTVLSYNRIPVLFSVMSEAKITKAKLADLLRHRHDAAYLAARQQRGPPLASIRAAACMECHSAADTSPSPVLVEREKSCLICHRELAAEAVASTKCAVCGMENCRMACITRAEMKPRAKSMLMAGIPTPLFLGGVGAVLVISFLMVEYLKWPARPARKQLKWNFLTLPLLASAVRQRWFRPLFQIPIFLLFCFLIYAGLAGDPSVNITPVMTWTIWWAGLIFLVLFFGKAWCFVCPWDFAATVVQAVSGLWRRSGRMTLGLRWPQALRNLYLAIGLFIFLTWLELGYGVTSSPKATAVLAIVLIMLSLVPALLFGRRSFCRYGCMIGRISGLYAMFSPVEIRNTDPERCKRCRTRECFHGSESVPPCPTWLKLPALQENTYCIQCGNCIRSCPSRNVSVNARPFAADLAHFRRPRADESLLAMILLALTSFHGLTMTPLWESGDPHSVIGWLQEALGVSRLTAFTVGMAGVIAVLMSLFWIMCAATRWIVADKNTDTRRIFLHFAYSLIPVALFYHLAHNAMHFFMEAQYVIPLLSDPLGRGWNLFGTAELRPGPLLSAQTIWWLQATFVLIGHVSGIIIAHHASRKLYADNRQARRSLLPMLGVMVLYSWLSLWILHLDMNMRSSLM